MTEKDYIETQDKQGEPKHRATSQPSMEKFGVVDENGDVVGWLTDDGAGAVLVEHVSGETVRLDEDGVHAPAISTGDAEITEATLLTTRGVNGVDIPSATWVSHDWGTPNKDELGEFDAANNQFTPVESGWYWVSAGAGVAFLSDGDRLDTRLYDVTNSNTVFAPPSLRSASAQSGNKFPQLTALVELTAGVNYEVQFQNRNSSCSITGVGHWHMRRAWR
ncbi:hypothetical protein [Halobacterium sp. KA-6]|uniref:hypothetical protein n=1 Tax=Halobacterium sp. KA-6 TaxID=2896368 RepID=UPI001E3C2EF4|nr:hypothetical protein [Halobacterium sp. KA-6]MCD2202734.1 hypothetical protein [Halobacterium sp. KA-6]